MAGLPVVVAAALLIGGIVERVRALDELTNVAKAQANSRGPDHRADEGTLYPPARFAGNGACLV